MLPKPLLILACAAAILCSVFIYKRSGQEASATNLTIGIIQTATHPALDQARDSFIAEMKKLSNGKVSFVVQNAEGSISQARLIAENFCSHAKIDAIYAIGTPAVQAAARAEKVKPIFISAVSDPDSLGILHPTSNICGTTDQVDSDAQIDLLKKMIPDIQTVSIVYNPGEHNSQVMVKKMQQSLQKQGIKNVAFGVHSESEIVQTISLASRKGEAILVPADNLVVGAMPLVAKEALKWQKPLIASDIPSVTKGALMAHGADYGDLGKQTAQIAYEVLLLSIKPKDIGVIHPINLKTAMNKKALETLHVTIPQELVSSITLVESKGEANVL